MKTVKLDLRLSVEEKEALRSRAKEAGLGISEYVRNWINGDVPTEVKKQVGPPKKKAVEEAIAKAKKLESNWKPMFKDNKLNKL